MPHAVAGDHSPGSVFSFLAVHEHWLVRIQDGQNFRDILLLGRHNAVHWHAEVTHTGRLDSLLFCIGRMLALAAQVDNSLYTEAGQTGPAFVRGLPTAVDVLIDLVEVGDASRLDSGCVGRPRRDGQKGQSQHRKRLERWQYFHCWFIFSFRII